MKTLFGVLTVLAALSSQFAAADDYQGLASRLNNGTIGNCHFQTKFIPGFFADGKQALGIDVLAEGKQPIYIRLSPSDTSNLSKQVNRDPYNPGETDSETISIEQVTYRISSESERQNPTSGISPKRVDLMLRMVRGVPKKFYYRVYFAGYAGLGKTLSEVTCNAN